MSTDSTGRVWSFYREHLSNQKTAAQRTFVESLSLHIWRLLVWRSLEKNLPAQNAYTIKSRLNFRGHQSRRPEEDLMKRHCKKQAVLLFILLLLAYERETAPLFCPKEGRRGKEKNGTQQQHKDRQANKPGTSTPRHEEKVGYHEKDWKHIK